MKKSQIPHNIIIYNFDSWCWQCSSEDPVHRFLLSRKSCFDLTEYIMRFVFLTKPWKMRENSKDNFPVISFFLFLQNKETILHRSWSWFPFKGLLLICNVWECFSLLVSFTLGTKKKLLCINIHLYFMD